MGIKICLMILVFLFYPVLNLATFLFFKAVQRFRMGRARIILHQVEATAPFDFNISDKFAKIMSMIFVSMNISSGIPISNICMLILLTTTFAVQKYLFIKNT